MLKLIPTENLRDPLEIDFLDFPACIFKAIEILTFTFFC